MSMHAEKSPTGGPVPPITGGPRPSDEWSAGIAAELAEVLANTAVNTEYRHLVVKCGRPAIGALPGQFFQLLCPQPAGEQPYLRRPMSLYGVDADDGTVEFL